MSDRIAAVVVTHNRLGELQTSVAALRAQTRPLDAILVLNSGSTDGTQAWLDAQPDVQPLHTENRGAAAAFALGLETALAQGFDWCWCMDDDAHPTHGALSALCDAVAARPDVRVFNSLALARDAPTHFAVGALWVRTHGADYLSGERLNHTSELTPYADADGLVNSIGGHFYLGTLLHRSVVERVGLPLAWLFYRGDEVEYSLRIMRAGCPIYIVTRSIVYHPEVGWVTLRYFRKTKFFETMPPQKRYYSIRNSMWIYRVYYAPRSVGLYAAKRLASAFLTELWLVPHKPFSERLAACNAALRGLLDGLRIRPARDANHPTTNQLIL